MHQPIALDCEDNNQCTDDLCDPATGQCKNSFNSAPCDDGNQCTVDDGCVQGQCVAGAQKDCAKDADQCQLSLGCSPLTGCQYSNQQGTFCNTGNNACPQGICSNGQCFIQSGQICTAKVGVDLCKKVDVAGQCTSNGKCVVSQAPASLTCPGCAGICVKCLFIQLCLPFSDFF